MLNKNKGKQLSRKYEMWSKKIILRSRSKDAILLTLPWVQTIYTKALVDLRGAHPWPLGPISFISMQFSGKIWPNNRLAPSSWGLAPPSGKSYIRH